MLFGFARRVWHTITNATMPTSMSCVATFQLLRLTEVFPNAAAPVSGLSEPQQMPELCVSTRILNIQVSMLPYIAHTEPDSLNNALMTRTVLTRNPLGP